MRYHYGALGRTGAAPRERTHLARLARLENVPRSMEIFRTRVRLRGMVAPGDSYLAETRFAR